MAVELVPVGVEELEAFVTADEYGFGHRYEEDDAHVRWAQLDLHRAVAARDGAELVSAGRNYSLELTLPGGLAVPAAGVSWISVRPTHRRRGILRSMMEHLVADAAAHEEPVAILTASEGGIYERFGFGVATAVAAIDVDSERARFRRAPSGTRLRMVEADEMLKLGPELFERVRPDRTGAVSRPDAWWTDAWAPKDAVKARFDVICEIDGRVEGFAVYSVDGTWIDGVNDKTVEIRDLVAATPDAEAALWQFLCGIDLTQRVTHFASPVDAELPLLLTDPRHVRTRAVRDWLWLRILDVGAVLRARRYAAEGSFVLEVVDDTGLPSVAGRYGLDASPHGATCTPTTSTPDLSITLADLGAVCLGGVDPRALLRARRVDEHSSDACARLHAVLAEDRAPYAFTWF